MGKTGRKFTSDEIQAARVEAAKIERRIARECLSPDFGFAEHVTREAKLRYRDSQLRLAERIEAGELDGNATVAQRIRYALTGDCPSLLP